MSKHWGWMGLGALLIATASWVAYSQNLPKDQMDERRQRSKGFEDKGLAEPFKGVTTNGAAEQGLFAIKSTGVTTEPVRKAADIFIKSLTPEQKTRTMYSVDDPEWRKWMNQDFYVRQGVGFLEMSDKQRDAAFSLLGASLSAKGLKLSRDIMHLNHTLGELRNNDFARLDDTLYWITIMGEPSGKEPWGWQIDGHHLIINYFVLGDQVVMTPAFFGSEPVIAHEGKYKGTVVLQDEQNKGIALVNSLTEEQRAKAVIQTSKTRNSNVGEAFKDNVVLDYAGLRGSEMTKAQRTQLLDLIHEYIRNMDDGHAKVKMSEVEKFIDRTYFAWIGESKPDSVFYYRVHSPVVMIEFDHQTPANLRDRLPNTPNREHIHAVVRTPNGNDYGKDLLRQHYEQHPHPHQH